MAKEKNKTELPQVMEGELQARLVKIREEAGLSISQMADALCLSENVIVNLENEAFDLLPEPPYVRGYLRNYAKFNENEDDPNELITRYEALRGADANELNFQVKTTGTISQHKKKRISPVWAQVITLAVMLGVIGFISTIPEVRNWFSEKWQGFSSQLDPSITENNPSLLGQLPVPTPLPEEELATSSQQVAVNTETSTQNTEANTAATKTEATAETSTDSTDETVTDTTTEASTEAKTETETTNTTESTTEIETAAASATDTINIKLVFNSEVWLRIKDKEKTTVFEGLNREGTEKVIDLQKPLTFRVGNAQGLSLFIDGKAVDISTYINGSIANFTLE